MIANDIRKLLQARPFARFRLNLADGQSIEIHHPDYLLIDPRGRTLNWYPTDEQEMAGLRGALVDVQLVVSIDLDIDGDAKRSGDANAA